jgi:hypothetical protein
MKLPTIWKKAVRGVSGSEDVLAEERLEAGGGMVRKLEGVTCAHQEMTGELLSHPGKIGAVLEQLRIGEKKILIECKLNFVNIAKVRQQ